MIQVLIWIVLWVVVIRAITKEGDRNMSKWTLGKDLKQKTEKRYAEKLYDDIYYCPFCGEEAYWDTDYGQQLFDYCPYCGEPMKEDKE